MQSASAGLIAASAAAGQRPVAYIEFDWAGGAGLFLARGGTGWTNETPYLITHTGDLSLAAPGDELVPPGEVGRLALTMDNTTQRYSWLRADGPLYASIGTASGPIGKRVRLWQGYLVSGAPEYIQVFTGVIADWREQSSAGTVTFECRDMGWEFAQQQRGSSTITQDVLAPDWISTLADMVSIPARVLDPGVYRIPFVWLDDESIITEIWDAANADGGRAYFDQRGLLRFENVLHWAYGPHLTAQWAFGEGDYQVLDPEFSSDDLATKITVEYLPRAIGPEAVLYTLRQPLHMPPSAQIDFEARFTWPAWSVVAPVATDYRVTSGGGFDMSDDVTLTLFATYAQKTTVIVTNFSDTFPAVLTHLQIRGLPLLGGPIEQVNEATSAPISFDRDRSVRGNPYIQTWAQANGLANFLAYKCGRIRPTWRLRNVPGVAQLELGDRVSFVDQRLLGTAVTREGFIMGLRWQGSVGSGFYQELDLLDVEAMYEFLDFYRIGVDALGGYKRCWH